jgi:hypothetical protein
LLMSTVARLHIYLHLPFDTHDGLLVTLHSCLPRYPQDFIDVTIRSEIMPSVQGAPAMTAECDELSCRAFCSDPIYYPLCQQDAASVTALLCSDRGREKKTTRLFSFGLRTWRASSRLSQQDHPQDASSEHQTYSATVDGNSCVLSL